MKRQAYRFWLGCFLLLAGLQPSGASVWSEVTHIQSMQVSDGVPVVRLRVYTSGTSGAWADPAGCGGSTGYIDIPLDGQTADAQELINAAYIAMLNHHHVLLEIVDNACSPAGTASVKPMAPPIRPIAWGPSPQPQASSSKASAGKTSVAAAMPAILSPAGWKGHGL